MSVNPSVVEKELLQGDVVVLHSPEKSMIWHLYGKKFRLRDMQEGSYIIDCRCAGARQFGGRILVIYRTKSGKIRRMRFNQHINFYKEKHYGKRE